MKLILLQGDNSSAINTRLQVFIVEAKKRGWEIINVVNKEKSIGEIFSAESLFIKERLIIVHAITILNDKDKKWLKENYKRLSGTAVIIADKELTKTEINSYPSFDTVETFELPKYIWNFLDSFYPGNSRNALLLFHKVIEKENPEFVFSLLAKHLRDLFWIEKEPAGIPYPPWRKNKLKMQQKRFKEGEIMKILEYLAEIDIKVKTSKTDLIETIDFLLVTEIQ
jgi:DNA polymerase III delta subunit